MGWATTEWELGVASKAQTAWDALNERQRLYMTVLYDEDQAVEAERKRDAASGVYDDTPASVWRWIDVVTPGSKLTSVQQRLALHDVRDEGAGSTLQALQRYDLIEVREEVRQGSRGRAKTVSAKLTKAGRAAVRAGTKEPSRRRRGELSQYAWERLVRLWKAAPGTVAIWGSATYDALVGRPNPPLAEGRLGDYRITEAGREHYRTHWARYAELYPDVAAPNPDDAAADPWPAALVKALRSLRSAVERAHQARGAAHRRREEAVKDALAPVRVDETNEHCTEWHALLVQQAQARAELAERHGTQATTALETAIRAYAHGVLRAYTASVQDDLFDAALVDAVTAAAEAGRGGAQIEEPIKCGLPRVDRAVQIAYAEATGTRKRRRALPKQMLPGPDSYSRPEPLPQETTGLESLARTVASYIADGALRRELHPPAKAEAVEAG
ncbi:hypothetical protein [Streptomyces ipomoeae]|uniref:hypothetical protein n=1 Tax=Streptomyces ipomoeae TaxID=103232 RepID=UPI0011465EE8|nr:hypothetical protein [Streptomyces ipomoeae]TQE33100.1 hypothetical protein Sipo7851_21620 [Streptomyces ipomoeae]